jgi:hypothetical protein
MRGLLAILLAALFLTVGPIIDRLAFAQQAQCGPLNALLMRLTVQFAERPLVVGATPNGGKFILLTNPDTGTWTIVLQQGKDVGCVTISGDGLVTAKPSKPGNPT